MTVDTEAEKKGGDREEGARGWGRRHPHTPSLWADALKPPFPDSRCARRKGAPWPGAAGPLRRRPGWGGPTVPAERSPSLRAGPRLTCCGLRRRSAARGAGGHLPPARGGGSPGVAHHLGRPSLLAGCGGRGGARRMDASRVGQALRPRRRDLPSFSSSSSPQAGASAARYRLDPFQGRAPSTRRQVQRSASCCGGGGCVGGRSSRPPARPGGPGGTPDQPCWGRGRGGESRRRGPDPILIPPTPPPRHRMQAYLPGEEEGSRWPPWWEL